MSVYEILLGVGFACWLAICAITAAWKGRGLGWGVLAALVPPLLVVLLLLPTRASQKPERVRSPNCSLGWVRVDRLPRVCSGCGKEIPLFLQDVLLPVIGLQRGDHPQSIS